MNKNKTIFIIQTSEQNPIKLVFEDDVEVNANGDNIEVKGKLSSIEAEKVLTDIFGSIDLAATPIDNIKEDMYYCSHCSSILDSTQIDTCMNTPNEFVDYCLECGNTVSKVKDIMG